MADIISPVKKVILRQDPRYAGHLDFETLRRLGIEHISNFSGKVWTDHNLHDPGITILEALCFALIDLGYRTRLPLADLLAQKNPTPGQDDNFFTAAQILSNNPLTINDYRKLLLDIDGVRNAWLEPAELEELGKIQYQGSSRTTHFNGLYQVYIEPEDELPPRPDNCDCAGTEVWVSDNAFIQQKKSCFQSDEVYLLHRVWETLHAHRNLCEDFLQPSLLEKEQIRLCANIEIDATAAPEKVWVDILRRVRELLTPDIRFYTLQELLDKGKNIDEIFEGRPLTPKSVGFVDIEELEKFQLPREVRLSDVFRVVAETAGVVAVENLRLEGWINCCSESGVEELTKAGTAEVGTSGADSWVLHLVDGHVPRVDSFNSCLYFSKNRVKLPEISAARRLELAQRYLRPNRKLAIDTAAPLPSVSNDGTTAPSFSRFDKLLPTGNYRSELGEYWSIQNDFPITYGIGDGHLVEMFQADDQLTEAQRLRKAQALQLKGYLLFFDQLLANYLVQLAHLRELFSMRPDDDPLRDGTSRHTIFTQRLDSVPLVERLIRFYQNSFEDTGLNDGDPLAVPVDPVDIRSAMDQLAKDEQGELTMELAYCDFKHLAPELKKCPPGITKASAPCTSDNPILIHHGAFDQAFRRNATEVLWQRIFNGTELSNPIILRDACGYWFLFLSADGKLALLSRRRYTSEAEARTAAGNVLIFGDLSEAYRTFSQPDEGNYSFEIVFRQKDYRDILTGLAETPSEYNERRQKFLDHLLARFSEQFSDYAALQFEKFWEKDEASERFKNDKARFLQHYDEIGRDRGRAFNHRKPAWQTNNLSGLEQKVAALTGLRGLHDSALCLSQEFTKPARYTYELLHPSGRPIFKGPSNFASPAAAQQAYQQLKDALDKGSYRTGDSASRLLIIDQKTGAKQVVQYVGPAAYKNKPAGLLDQLLGKGGEIIVHKSWRLLLKNAQHETVRQSDTFYNSAQESLGEVTAFVLSSGKKKARAAGNTAEVLRLVPHPDQAARLLDLAPLRPEIIRLPDEFFWYNRLSDQRSLGTWSDQSQPRSGFVEALKNGQITDFPYLRSYELARQVVLPGDKRGEFWLIGATFFSNDNCARLEWFDWRAAGKKRQNFRVSPVGDRFQVELLRNDSQVIAHSKPFQTAAAAESHLSLCLDKLGRKGLTFSATDVKGTFTGFHFQTDKGEVLLDSFQLFDTLEAAFQAMEALPGLAANKDTYVSTGDAGNPEYTFMVRDSNEAFVAFQPEIFDNPGERDARRKKALAWFADWQNPVEVRAEPDRFQYKWQAPLTGETLLQPGNIYFFEKDAVEAFETAVRDIWSQSSATPPASGQTGAVLQALAPFIYQVEPEEFNREWQFVLGAGYHNWESQIGYPDPGSASDALHKFQGNLDQAQFRPIDIGGKPTILLESGGIPAISQQASALPADRDRMLAELPGWLNWKSNYGHPAIVRNEPTEISAPAVIDVAQHEQKVLQLVKTGNPLAVRPVTPFFSPPQFSKGDCPSWYNPFCWDSFESIPEDCSTQPEWLDLCLDGRDVTEREDQPVAPNGCRTVYRYVLRTSVDLPIAGIPAETVLWRSVETFDSEAEAIAAFQQHYLEVLLAANNPVNYGAEKSCIGFEPEKGPESPTTPCPCRTCPSGASIADVPRETWERFDYDAARTAQILSELARSYPVFQVVAPDEQCSCACLDPGCCADEKPRTEDCSDKKQAATKQYKFHLYAPNYAVNSEFSGRVLWESPRCYDHPVEAWADFQLMIRLIEQGDACRLVPNQCVDCGTALGIVEVLLEAPLGDQENSTEKLKQVFMAVSKEHAFHIGLNYDCANETDALYQIQLVTEGYRVAVHPGQYLTEKSACEARDFAFNLIKETLNTEWCRKLYTENAPQPETGVYLIKVNKTDGYTIQVQASTGRPGEDPLVLLECIERFVVPPGLTDEQIDGLLEGLKSRLCALLGPDSDNLRISGQGDCNAFTYELAGAAGSEQILAWHPNAYDSFTEVNTAVDRIKQCLFHESFYLVEHILLRPGMTGMDYCRRVNPTKCPPQWAPSNPKLKIWPAPAANWQWTQGCCPANLDAKLNTLCDGPFPLSLVSDCELFWYRKPLDPTCPEPETPEHYYPLTDPYSFWATVVLPGYTPRFSDPDFRRFFEETLRREAPAHVAICIRWLGPMDMCCFEAHYQRWVNWLRTGQKNCPLPVGCQPNVQQDLDPGCLLGNFLHSDELVDCPPAVAVIDPVRAISTNCNCDPKTVVSGTPPPVCASIFVQRTTPEPKDCKPAPNGAPAQPTIDLVEPPPAVIAEFEDPAPLPVAGPGRESISKSASSPKPSAPSKNKTSPKAPEKVILKPDIKKVQQRQAHYKKAVEGLVAQFDNTPEANDLFARAQHFVVNNGAIERLAPMLERLAPAGSKPAGNLQSMMRIVLYHALDKLALEQPGQIPDTASKALQTASAILRKAGLDPAALLDEWDPETLAFNGATQTTSDIQSILTATTGKPKKKK